MAGLLLVSGGRALLTWSRCLQPSAIRHLEEPAAQFLRQTIGRSHLEVTRLQPLQVVASLDATATQADVAERALATLLALNGEAGEQLLVVRGPVPFHLSDHPLFSLLVFALGLGLARRGAGGLRFPVRPLQCSHQKNKWRRRLGRLGWVLLWLTTSVALVSQQLPLALASLSVTLALRWRGRRATFSPRPIVNGRQEAAIVLISYAPEESAKIFKLLGPDKVHEICLEISKLPPISPPLRKEVLRTFQYYLDGLCRRSCQGGTGSCRYNHMAKTLLEFYLDSVVTGSLFSRARRRVYTCPTCDEVFVDEESILRHQLTHGSNGINYRLATPRVAVSSRKSSKLALLRKVTLASLLIGVGWLLRRHDPASLSAQVLRDELSRFIGARHIVTEMVDRGDRQGCAVALVGLTLEQGNSARPLVLSWLARRGLVESQIALLTVQVSPPWAALGLLPLLGAGLWWRRRGRCVVEVAPAPPVAAETRPVPINELAMMDPLVLELGSGLRSLVDSGLHERITSIRGQFALDMGIVMPAVRCRDDAQRKPNEYVIKVNDVEVARGDVLVGKFLAIGPEEKLRNLRGTKAVDPTYGMPGVWVDANQRSDAERLGCKVFDPVSVVATQLTEVVRQQAFELLTFSAAESLLKTADLQGCLHQLDKRGVSMVTLWQVLRLLVWERVSIRNLPAILQGMLEICPSSNDPEELCERAREVLGAQIVSEFQPKDAGPIEVWRVPGEMDDERVTESLARFYRHQAERGRKCLVVTPPQGRRRVLRLARPYIHLAHPLIVLSQREIGDQVRLCEVSLLGGARCGQEE